MKPIKTILHPSDLSEGSQDALELAGFLARDQKARLIILHVVPKLVPVTGAGDSGLERAETYQHDLRKYQEEMMTRLSQLKPADPRIQVERLLREGEVSRVILRTTMEIPCDLIVMGTHGQGAQLQRPMGRVAEEVSRRAPCPVLLVKRPV